MIKKGQVTETEPMTAKEQMPTKGLITASAFRPATRTDCRWLWQLRNHPSVAAQSFSTEPIPYKNHCRWFRNFRADGKRQLDIFLLDIPEQHAPQELMDVRVGYVRADPFETGRILSWAISPSHQGRGLGALMLQRWCAGQTQRLWAKIKSTNEASKAIARKAGFSHLNTENATELWRRG